MPTTSAVSNSSIISAASSDTSSRIPVQTLGQNDFLKLLTTQMSSQDPLNPKSDLDFTAQLAQFSALQNSQDMGKDIAELKAQQQFFQASSLIGSTVTFQSDTGTVKTGVVSAMDNSTGKPLLVVNGQSYELSKVLGVFPTPVTPPTTP